jgi:hypothetical protein
MKKLFIFAALISLASCDIYLLDESYVNYDDRDLLIGDYHVEEYSQTTENFYRYDITITKSCCKSDEIRISNFYGSDLTVYASVYDNRLTIPLQQVDGYEIEGTGKMNHNNKLTLTFVIRDLYERPVFADFVDVEGWLY